MLHQKVNFPLKRNKGNEKYFNLSALKEMEKNS